jgi:Anaphase-promoting complex sub unit 1 C-terminal domain
MPAPAIAAAVVSTLPPADPVERTTTHAALPSTEPTWAAAHDEVLTTTRDAPSAPYTTRWASQDTTRTSLATPARPRSAPLLAPIPALADRDAPGAARADPALVVAAADFVHVCASGGGLYECPLPRGLGSGAAFARVFAAGGGLIVECERGGSGWEYYSLMHPLEEMVRITGLARGERVVFTSADVGVVVSSSDGGWTVWGVEEVPAAAPQPAGELVAAARSDHARGRDVRMVADDDSGDRGDGEVSRPNNLDGLEDFDSDAGGSEGDAPSPGQRTCLVVRKLFSAAAVETQESPGTALNRSCCLAHTAAGELVLCACSAGRLTALRLTVEGDCSVTSATVVFALDDVSAAVGVLSTRLSERALDLLVLRASSPTLALYAGDALMCTVALPGRPEPVVALRDAVGCRVTAVYADGWAVRVSLRRGSPASALVGLCIAAVSRAFAGDAGEVCPELELRRALLRGEQGAEEGGAEIDPGGGDHEWNLFVEVLLSAARHCRGSPTPRPSPAPLDGDEGGDEDWAFLLRSAHHKTNGSVGTLARCSSPARATGVQPGSGGADGAAGPALSAATMVRAVEAMHLLCEDMKLSVLARADRRRLASCVTWLAAVMGAVDVVDYYRRDGEDVRAACSEPRLDAGDHRSGLFQKHSQVPSMLEWLSRCVQSRHDGPAGDAQHRDVDPFPDLDPPRRAPLAQPPHLQASWRATSPVDRSRKVTRYYAALFGALLDETELPPDDRSFSTNVRPLRVLRAMCRDGFGPRDLDALPFGVALPLREALWACRNSPGDGLPSAGDVLVGREDLWDVAQQREEGRGTRPAADDACGGGYRALLRIHAASATYEDVEAASGDNGGARPSGAPLSRGRHGDAGAAAAGQDAGNDSGDGCDLVGTVFKLRFAADRRVSEVRRLLRSTEPVVVHLSSAAPGDLEGLPEGERPNEQPWLLSRMAALLKRHLAAPVGRGAFTLRTFTPSDPTMPLSIPHICLKGKVAGQKGAKLTFNPDAAPYRTDWGDFHNGAAAGLRLVALGSAGDGQRDGIGLLTRTWIVNHRPTNTAGNASHAGMLLALGLGGYLPALRATDYYEYLVPMHDLTTIGLMLGVAAGNRASLHAKITKMLCVHIRHFNGPGFAVPDFHVSLTVQAAAALGIGLLYQGTCEHLIVEGLLVELSRRPQPGDAVQDRECLSIAAGIGVGLVCLGVGSPMLALSDLHLLDTLCLYAIGGPDPSHDANGGGVGGAETHHAGGAKPGGTDLGAMPPPAADSETSRVREGGFVNVDVTGPGALLALALVYLKSNDANVAQRIVLPETMYALDRARPDHVYLRCLARHLIMWDGIRPSREWVLSSLPDLLAPPAAAESAGIDLTHLRSDGEAEGTGAGAGAGGDVDEDGILLARAFAVAGACTAIALRCAGSMNRDALDVLVGVCVSFEAVLVRQVEDDEEAEWVYATCLNAAALAISVVAAGSGDLDVLRLLRRVRKRSGPSLRQSRYGTHMATHMAIGFLFLGGGCLTFGTSKTAVAALLCAIYPRFPCDVEDNQYHLQAMRHLYVLAVEPRCVEARDVDTDLPCSVAVCVNLTAEGGESRRVSLTAPCILPDARLVESVSVVSERYWPKVVRVRRPVASSSSSSVDGWFSPTKRQILYVKRRAGHLPHDVDPTGSKGMMARSFGQPRRGEAVDSDVGHLVRAFSADPKLRTFVGHFCESSARRAPPSPGTVGQAERYGEILYECLSLDKPEAVQCYLEIERALAALTSARACPTSMGSLALLGEYASVRRRLWGCAPLVRRDYLWRAVLQARALLETEEVRADLARYVRSGGADWPAGDGRLVGRALQLYRVPGRSVLEELSGRASCSDEDDAWLTVGSALPGDTPTSALELVARVLAPGA